MRYLSKVWFWALNQVNNSPNFWHFIDWNVVEYPDGSGWAKDINDDGSLKIETPSGELLNLTSPLISEII